jgi:hypothetical protein
MTKELGENSENEEVWQQIAKKAESRPNAPRSSKVFYERARAAGAFENIDDGTPLLDERRYALLEAYMTTPATMKELQSQAGVGEWRVNNLIHDAYRKIRRNLPKELRDEYRGLSVTEFVKPKRTDKR